MLVSQTVGAHDVGSTGPTAWVVSRRFCDNDVRLVRARDRCTTMTNRLLSAAESGDLEKLRERLDLGDDIEYRHRGTGRTPLLEAVIAGHCGAVILLLDSGADIDAACTAVGASALGWAVVQDDLPMVVLLVARGADPNLVPASSSFARTPLMAAAQNGNTEIIRRLLAAGADPGATDGAGLSALALARQALEHGASSAAAVALLESTSGADPDPPAPPGPIPWPLVPWEEGVGAPICADASPTQIVRGYIVAMSRWGMQSSAVVLQASPLHEAAEHDPTVLHRENEIQAALHIQTAIRDAYCTDRPRKHPRANVAWPPEFVVEQYMISEYYPRPSRCEIVVRDDRKAGFGPKEIAFVVLRQKGRWRIDSAKQRLTGGQSWHRTIL